MDPKSENSKFGVTIELVKDVNTLNDLADVSHVEHVMRFCWSRKEVFSNSVVEIDGCICQSLRDLFDLVIEILGQELMGENILEDSSDL